MPHYTDVHAKGDAFRDTSTFPGFPQIRGLDSTELARWIDALEVSSVSAHEWKWHEHWSVEPRVVKDSMWFCFLQGSGSGWIGNEHNKFRYKAGDMVLLPQGVLHYITQDKHCHSHLIAVHFFARIFGVFDIVQTIGFPAVLHSGPNFPHVQVSKRLAREFAAKPPGWKIAMDAEICSLLLSMIRFHARECRLPMKTPSLSDLARFQPLFRLIDQKMHDPNLSVKDMAGTVFLSEVQFRKVFHRLTDMNPTSYLQRHRIERACRLLRSTTESVETIAEKCGFSQTPFFYRAFRRWTSTTPRTYRECRSI